MPATILLYAYIAASNKYKFRKLQIQVGTQNTNHLHNKYTQSA